MAFSITYPLVWQLKRVVSSIHAPTDPHKKWGVHIRMWTSHLKKWGSTDPLDPVAPRPLKSGVTCALWFMRVCELQAWVRWTTCNPLTQTRFCKYIWRLCSCFVGPARAQCQSVAVMRLIYLLISALYKLFVRLLNFLHYFLPSAYCFP